MPCGQPTLRGCGLRHIHAVLYPFFVFPKVEGSTELSEADLVLIHEAKVSGLIWVDGINLHVGGLDE